MDFLWHCIGVTTDDDGQYAVLEDVDRDPCDSPLSHRWGVAHCRPLDQSETEREPESDARPSGNISADRPRSSVGALFNAFSAYLTLLTTLHAQLVVGVVHGYLSTNNLFQTRRKTWRMGPSELPLPSLFDSTDPSRLVHHTRPESDTDSEGRVQPVDRHALAGTSVSASAATAAADLHASTSLSPRIRGKIASTASLATDCCDAQEALW